MDISTLQEIIGRDERAEVLVRKIFYDLQEKGAKKLLKKFIEADQCEEKIQDLLNELQGANCPNVPTAELRIAVWNLCLSLLHNEFKKNK
ncbi:MAG: hypothetical protein AAB575_04280 [Patescibacteria group bacterium]